MNVLKETQFRIKEILERRSIRRNMKKNKQKNEKAQKPHTKPGRVSRKKTKQEIDSVFKRLAESNKNKDQGWGRGRTLSREKRMWRKRRQMNEKESNYQKMQKKMKSMEVQNKAADKTPKLGLKKTKTEIGAAMEKNGWADFEEVPREREFLERLNSRDKKSKMKLLTRNFSFNQLDENKRKQREKENNSIKHNINNNLLKLHRKELHSVDNHVSNESQKMLISSNFSFHQNQHPKNFGVIPHKSLEGIIFCLV